ncbi:hypothetical protein GE061_015550 [Apolygus lucorum]|uniref:Prokaryotic-type class I peptide chain release factors domain-containing protein n=1 Tax=Apolygus lucorum TaxID=248454 RepID=A0A8S9XLB1_APOLU|nr:hypothetical protein GE061_015550 [Apolygus lucorum]
MSAPTAKDVISLYKQLLRYGNQLRYTDRSYFIKRVREEFKSNKQLSTAEEREFFYSRGKEVPVLKEKDIEEQFITGSGPGGSNVAKNNNCALLRHIPTGGFLGLVRGFSTSSPSRFKDVERSLVPVLNEDEIDEQFVKGSGPGGQNVNKRANCVVLRHIPSGIVVKCHESRLLETNRKLAREKLVTKLDNMLNGENSVENQIKAINEKKSSAAERKKNKLRDLKERSTTTCCHIVRIEMFGNVARTPHSQGPSPTTIMKPSSSVCVVFSLTQHVPPLLTSKYCVSTSCTSLIIQFRISHQPSTGNLCLVNIIEESTLQIAMCLS